MNRKMILFVLGRIIELEGIALCVPLITALLYGEWNTAAVYAATAAGTIIIGIISTLIFKKGSKRIYAKEGFVTVALAWIVISLIGAVPMCISGDIPSYVDAFFETVSGFTTTGASVVSRPDLLSHATNIWRAFTHWIGGMGILVLMVAIFPDSNGRTIHIMRAEMPGPVVDKIVPKARDTAKILYIIYIVLTAFEAVMLLCGGLSVYDSLFYALGTAGTGGFGIKATSAAEYTPYVQWVLAVFMILFGINFNLYFLVIRKKFKQAIASEELRVYLILLAISSVMIGINVFSLYPTVGETVRHSVFQVAALVTTTGYTTVDINAWPTFSKAVVFILMFFGGCAGSTAGGLKQSRLIIMAKNIHRHLKRMLHPRSVVTVRFEGKPVDEAVRHNVSTYFLMYCFALVAVFLLVSVEPFDLETNLSAAVSCFNNVGPAFGKAASGYGGYGAFGKIVLSAAMLLGRLELYPLMLTFSPEIWKK